MIDALGLAYRILDIATGDLGQSHHRSFDIEVYAPGCDQWLEVSSVSWFSDYQARRANIRYRPAGAKGTEPLHTLNGSALAVPRVLAAILETYRQPDGSVAIPEVLWPYTRGARDDPRSLTQSAESRAPLAAVGHAIRARPLGSATRNDRATESARRYFVKPLALSHSLATSASAFLSTSISTISFTRPSVSSLALTASSTAVDAGR